VRAFPPLQAIVDVDTSREAGWSPIDLARSYFEGGARFLQVRAKQLAAASFLDISNDIVRLGEEYGAAVIINDRVDLARLSGAAGAHVGQEDVPPSAARRLLGPEAIVGFSTHTIDQVGAALEEPVSYIAVGPVFGTRSKETGYSAVGLTLVADAARIARGQPILAIGGITLDRAADVLAAGATTVAVISDLLSHGTPSARVAAYLRALG
jgi:thiamine-phosphate pyrophosphorylase